jgi:RNA polymerase sigma factor (sigma-70 family)
VKGKLNAMAVHPYTDESILLMRIAKRDQAALGMLYDRYASFLYAFSFKFLGSPEEAEEVVLDVFNQVWCTAERYDAGRSRVDTWLCMLARSRALDRLRSLKRAGRLVDENTASPAVEPRTFNPEEDAMTSERRTMVISALKNLPDGQRKALELVYYGGLTHTEVASHTGEPVGTIKTRIRLGLGKLRETLSPTWGHDPL